MLVDAAIVFVLTFWLSMCAIIARRKFCPLCHSMQRVIQILFLSHDVRTKYDIGYCKRCDHVFKVYRI